MNENDNKKKADEIIDQIKELVNKGNISRIMVEHNGNMILNIPLNVGIVGTVLGITAAPWALVATAIATLGFDCKVLLEKTDGNTVEILSRDVGGKAVEFGTNVVNEVKDRFHNN